MTILFGGGELPSFNRFNAIETTVAGSFRAPARCGVHVRKGGWLSARFTTANELWFHLDIRMELFSPSSQPISVRNSQGTVLFSINSDGTIRVGNTLIGTANIFTTGLFTLDIRLSTGSSGIVELYADKQIIFSASGNFTFTGMNTIMLAPTGSDASENTNTVYSQVVVADEPTIGFQLATLAITGAGDSSQWVGSFEQINEVVTNDNTFINTSTAGQINTFQIEDLNSQYSNIKAVIISALGRFAQVGPKNLDAVIRLSGTNYLTPMTPLGSGFTASQAVLHANPATFNPWNISEVNNAQMGIRSKV